MRDLVLVQKLPVVTGHLYRLTRINHNTSLVHMFIILIEGALMEVQHGILLIIQIRLANLLTQLIMIM